MKTTVIIFFFVAVATLHAQAQDTKKSDSFPYWTISKDVQRMQYKNIAFVPSTIVTGNNTWAISKGIQRVQADQRPTTSGSVVTGTRPTWYISKGVARFQAERNK